MPSELDHAPHLLLLELEEQDDLSEAHAKGAIDELDANGATFERISVKRAQDMMIAAGFALKSKGFEAVVVLANLASDAGLKDMLSKGLQRLALEENASLSYSFLTVETGPNQVEAVKQQGRIAAQSALRLFAIKARFNPLLNEA